MNIRSSDNSTIPFSNKSILLLDLVISGAAVIFLVWLIYFQNPAESPGGWGFLSAMNACLNAFSAVLLLTGYYNVKRGNLLRHKLAMSGALFSSAVFLVGYILYHTYHGDTPFGGKGWSRPLYYSILITHVVLSIVMLPLILYTYSMGLAGRLRAHRKTAALTFWIWLYVSVTGVLIYFFLRVWFLRY